MCFQIMEKEDEGSVSTEFPRVHPETNVHAQPMSNGPVQLLSMFYVESFSHPKDIGFKRE